MLWFSSLWQLLPLLSLQLLFSTVPPLLRPGKNSPTSFFYANLLRVLCNVSLPVLQKKTRCVHARGSAGTGQEGNGGKTGKGKKTRENVMKKERVRQSFRRNLIYSYYIILYKSLRPIINRNCDFAKKGANFSHEKSCGERAVSSAL